MCPACDQYNGWNEDGDYNRDLDLTGSQAKRFVRQQKKEEAHTTNGFCLNCNLNQELKVSQLARCPHEGAELEEYRDHLEKVYRLCPECEDTLQGVLAEQDRSLAGKLLEWRLENSRLSSSRLKEERTRCGGRRVGLEPWLSLLVLALLQDYSPLSVPGCLLNINTVLPTSLFPHVTLEESLAQLAVTSLPVILLSLVSIIILLSVLRKRFLPSVLYLVLMSLLLTGHRPEMQVVVAVLGVLTWPRVPGRVKQEVKERSTTCHLTPPPARSEEELETRTQDLLSSSDGDLTVSPHTRSPPIRSTGEISFNHEFSTTPASQRDCDLSSLSIGDFSSGSPSVRSTSTFQLRSYSVSSGSNSLFSPSRPILRPARLTSTSWVAGGYWTPPAPTSPPPPLSRTSSQSSGFISATPSLANYNYQTPLQSTPSHSVFSEPLPGPLKLRRRTVEDSISDSSCQAPVAGKGWTFTVTITPTGVLLAASLIVNITMAVFWFAPSTNQ